MRKMIVGALLLGAVGIHAQTDKANIETSKAIITDSLYLRGRDPFYFQLYLGGNKSANENLPWTEFSKYPWSTGLFFAVGREFNRLWGWRAALRINRNKSRNVQECESPEVWAWSSTSLFADATFDISDAFRKNKIRHKTPKFNLKAFAGIGGAYTYDFDKVPLSYTHPYSRSSRLVPAVRLGLNASLRLSDRWRVGAELSQTMFADKFNGVAYDNPMDGRTNFKVGLTFLIVKKKKPRAKPIVRKVKLKECPPLPLIMPDPEADKTRVIQGHAFLDFPVNETVIYPDYRKNPDELAKIHKSIDSAMFDKAVVVTRISLHGYASPESPYSNNTRLAKGRTEALKDYLVRRYNFESGIFKASYTPEDWGNLRGFLTDIGVRRVKGDFWYDNKSFVEMPEIPDFVLENRSELLRIIGRNIDPDVKNELLKKVADGEPYRWLLEYVYPGLRHTDYIIEYKIRPFSVEKGRKLIYSHPEGMSLEEMYNVAMSYDEGSDNWVDALLIAVNQYPNDQTANFNAACASVMTHRLSDAKKYLSKAGDSANARYVADVIKAMEGSVHWKVERNKVILYEGEPQMEDSEE